MTVHSTTRWIKAQSHYLLWAAWLVLALEWLSRSGLWETLLWVGQRWPFYVLNTLLVGSLLMLAAGLTGSSRAAFWTLSGCSLLLAYISGALLRIIGRPIGPEDLTLIREAVGVARWQEIVSLSQIMGLLAFGAGGYLLAHRLGPPQPPGRVGRTAIVLTVGALLAAAFWAGPPPRASWDPVVAVRTEGFMLTEARDLTRRLAGPGAVASVARLESGREPGQDAATQPPDAPVKPNIILILSESFWDPTLLPDARFERDPIPFFHKLQATYPHGWLLSPEFGGSTANVELEVLTGLSRQFFPPASTPYMQSIKKPTDSLASILSRQGYRTAAITPWQHWFFKSEQVYRLFGFGKFTSVEFFRPKVSGDYMADSETARMIIDESSREPGPYFLFANTSENHTAYYVGKFPEGNSIAVSGLPDLPAGIVATYAEGCRRADEMLATLVDHFTQRPEPTMIVWFGDHLPNLGQDYLAYRAAGYITGPDAPDFLEKMHRVPALIWTNYQTPRSDTFAFGANQLGPYILEQAALGGTPFTEYLRGLRSQVPAVPARRYWGALGLPGQELAEYEALQNDIVYGDQVAYGALKEQIINPQYVVGLGPMAILGVEMEAATGSAIVRGRNLPVTAVLYANGQPVKTVWESESQVRASLPRGRLELEVRVLDEEREVVAGSPAVVVTVGGSD